MFLNNFFTKKIKLTENKAVLSADELEAMIRNSATQRGMDPDVAVRVWRSEGGTSYQSNIPRDGKGSEGGKEASYGPFQLYTGGGLGNDYEEKYGVDLRDDNTPEGIQRQIDFALNQAIEKGWGPWNGAKEVGIKPTDGLDNAVAKAYIPPDENVPTTAFTPPPAVDANQNAIDILQKEFQSAMKRGDGKAMNDILASVKGLGGNTAVQQVAQGNSEPSANTAQAFTPAEEEEKSYADMGKTALPTSLSVTQRELKDAQAGLEALTLNGTQEEVAKAQADVDRLEGAVESNKDMQAGGLEGPASLTSDQADYAKAKEGALLQGKDDVTSIADDDLKRRRAEAYANQQEKNGNTEVADAARAEAKRHEALRMEKLTKGITFGQGSLEQQEQQMKQWDKTKAEGGDPTQSWKGGVITDPKELADWQTRNQEADRKQKEQGTYTIDKTIDDYKDEVDPDASAPQAQSYSAPVKSAGGAVKPGSGYSQGGVQKPATPTKQRQHYRDKYSALTPAFMMDEPDAQAVYARERLKKKAGELMRTNPAEWNKLYGGDGDKLGKAIEKAEQDAYAKFDEPQTTQKPAPIVDQSTQYQSDRNANAYDGKIGDAYRTLSEPKVEPVKPVTTGSKQTVGSTQTVKPVKFSPSGAPIKETRDFENWVNEAEMKNDPCWDGYEMIGHKEKGGKKVPNCVPKKSVKEQAPMEYEGEPPQQKTNPIGVIRQGKKVYDMVKGGKVKDTAKQTVIDIIKNATRDDASSRNRLPKFLQRNK